MKFTFIVIHLSAIVVASSALGGGVEGQAAVANDADKSTSTNSQLQQHQQQRDLLSSWCPSSTPVLWHRDLTKTWSAGACICDTYVTSTYLLNLLFAKLKHSICDSNERALSWQQPCPIRYFTGCLQPAWYYASNV